MRITRLLLLAMLTLAMYSASAAEPRRPKGDSPPRRPKSDPIFSILETKNASREPAKPPEGFYVYVVEAGKGEVGPFVEVFRYRDGKLTDFINGGSASAKLVKQIEDIHFEGFDFEQEVKATSDRLKSTAESRGETFYPPIVLDGAEYEISYNSGTVKFRMKARRPSQPSTLFQSVDRCVA
jgi:hypothetical protein